MTRWRTGATVGVVLLALLAFLNRKPTEIKQTASKPLPAALTLKPDEEQKVIVNTDARTVTVVRKAGPNEAPVAEIYRGVRKAEIIQKKDGSVTVTARQYGFCFEPGLGVAVGEKVGPSVDVQFAYWKDAGLLVGARPWPLPTAFLAASYALDAIHLPNVSVYAGAALRREFLVGARVRV